MKITFLGGANEVGASSTLLEVAGKKLLIDVGIRISNKSFRGIEGDQLPDLHPVTEVGGPDYILVTHAHTDHTGALPLVMEQYPDVPVFATIPTIALTKVLQADAQIIMKNRQEQEGELPHFDEVSVNRLLDAFQPVDFRQRIRLGDGLQITYHPAGHIVGAGSIVIESEEGILVMSGDLSMSSQRAVVKADIPRINADFLVLESTYGGRLHANRNAEEQRLVETVKRIIDRGGKALIPAFALGRAQEIIQILLNYRDEIDAPVWVDGMVRSVCRAYSTFPELLPEKTVKAAGEDELFFRKNIKAVKSPVQREEIARSEGPCIIVSSSGMLTGGPSAAFAKWLAGDERNGIFLTGYQDEESPGRFIQNVIRQKEKEDEVTFKIDDTNVTLRCELGTYALSAHADENELISIAEATGADDIALVHGDHGARHSLASSLRDRGKIVRQPASSTSYELQFKKRPWAIGVKKGSESRPLDPEALWKSLKDEAGNYFSARELAHAWWGDSDRDGEVITILENDGVYFAQDWRKSTTFQVRSPEKIARTLNQRKIMRDHPNIVGQVIVLYDGNKRPRIGVVTEAEIDSFKARMFKTKGTNYPADALIWAVADLGDFEFEADNPGLMRRLSDLWQRAESLTDIVLPFEKRQKLSLDDSPVDPRSLIPEKLPENMNRPLALLTIVLALAKDGVSRIGDKLLVRQARQTEPMEMNLARKTVLAAFPEEARLRKVGMDRARNRLNLLFDFPVPAQQKYEEVIDLLQEQTRWDVVVLPDVNQQALGAALYEIIPPDGRVIKGPSFYMDRQEVMAEIEGVEDREALVQAYRELTGFTLLLDADKSNGGKSSPAEKTATPFNDKDQMEINSAYGVIRSTLGKHGLYKAGLKQGRIVLAFISPQVGMRYTDTIAELAEETGYELTIHPHPNQNAILQVVQTMLREAGYAIRKGPGIHVDRATVSVTLNSMPDEAAVTDLKERFEEQTGYQLVLET